MARCRTTPQTPKKTQWPLAVLCREAPGRYSPPQAKGRFSTNRGLRCVVGVTTQRDTVQRDTTQRDTVQRDTAERSKRAKSGVSSQVGAERSKRAESGVSSHADVGAERAIRARVGLSTFSGLSRMQMHGQTLSPKNINNPR